MLSVGETLRRARLEQGLDLPTVAVQTKISIRYLAAIEADERKDLPSGFFYKSFVEQYARLLSLDTREISAEVDVILSADAPLPLPGYESRVARNVPPMEVTRQFGGTRVWASLGALILAVAGCSGVYAWWHKVRLGASESVIAKSEPTSSPAAVSPASPPQPVSVSRPASGTPRASVSTAAPLSTPSPESTPAPIPAPASESTPASASGSPAPEPAPRVAEGYKLQLDLIAHEETWLSISSDGKRIFSGILSPNQSKTVEGRESATMKVGNAAGIDVRLNGRPIGPLGARGQVLVVVFTPDNFQIVPQAPREGD